MKLRKLLFSIVFAFSFLLMPFHETTSAQAKNMYVHFINVGQGDAIYIKAPNGEDILIDGGNNSYGDDVVNYLKKQKVDDIEIMIATHPDADHIGGLDTVLSAFRVEQVYAPKVSHTTESYKDFLNAVKREGKKIKTAQANVALPIKGVTAKFVGPVKAYPKSDLNNWSAVLKLTYGKKSFLFTGDAELKAESDMIKAKQNLRADVLKVGHHGAKTSTSTALLNSVKPTYAVISVGKNSYGHPTQDVINRLKAYKINTFRTDKQGHIVATTNGSNLSFNVKAASSGAASQPTSYKLTASVDNKTPKQNSTIILNVKGLPNGTKYKAVFKYKSKNTTYTGTIGKPLSVKIGRAAKGYTVKIDVSATYKNKTYKAQTSFTPR